MARPPGPPYLPPTAVVGGVPSPVPDDAVSGALVLLFLASAAAHMTILRRNKRRGRRFVFSGMLFVLCVLRSVALVLRVAWASRPRDPGVALAATILTQVGSVLVFVINLILAQRVVRAYHPRVGWHPAARGALRFLVASVVASLVTLIVVTLQSVFTLDLAARAADRAVQLVAGTYLAVLAFVPVPVVLVSAALRAHRAPVDKFGAGRWRSKLQLLLLTACVATLGAGFRVGTGYAAVPRAHPAWFDSRACYYGFNFATDLVVSTVYLFARFDRRFIIPNGAKGESFRDCAAATSQPPKVHALSGCISSLRMDGRSYISIGALPPTSLRVSAWQGPKVQL
ncbi:hypothetical protein F4780DRAFT_773905 [Xylariomycetidae sp. FL0641]|nr:hypothetical protein F4780DRAFT_773905 [Xylariomycetidae sp. FL0641]